MNKRAGAEVRNRVVWTVPPDHFPLGDVGAGVANLQVERVEARCVAVLAVVVDQVGREGSR